MKKRTWRFYFEFGWFKGNPLICFKLALGEIGDDYPNGWLNISFFAFQIGRLCIDFGICK